MAMAFFQEKRKYFLLEVFETQNKTKQHLTDAEDDGYLHLERVQKRNLVLRQLPHLQPIIAVY